jgi:hypothetical protein
MTDEAVVDAFEPGLGIRAQRHFKAGSIKSEHLIVQKP